MTAPTMGHRERAAIEAYERAKALGQLAYDAWLAALRAYGDDGPHARRRVNEILAAAC